MDRVIFREYDIRGVVETDLTLEVVNNIGKAFGTVVKRVGGKAVTVGQDARESSPILRDSIVSGILSTGVNVVQIGLVPTPLLYYSLHHLKVDGGVMITGSHNPPEFNGFKLNLGKDSIHGLAIQEMADMIEKVTLRKGKDLLQKLTLLKTT